MVVGELCMGDLISPGTWVRSVEDPKVHFNFLVDMFCFAVGLGVISSEEGEVVIQEFAKFFSKGRGELRTTIQDDFVIQPKM